MLLIILHLHDSQTQGAGVFQQDGPHFAPHAHPSRTIKISNFTPGVISFLSPVSVRILLLNGIAPQAHPNLICTLEPSKLNVEVYCVERECGACQEVTSTDSAIRSRDGRPAQLSTLPYLDRVPVSGGRLTRASAADSA